MRCCLALVLAVMFAATAAAQKATPIWIDTDLGSDVDDA